MHLEPPPPIRDAAHASTDLFFFWLPAGAAKKVSLKKKKLSTNVLGKMTFRAFHTSLWVIKQIHSAVALN
jgi:hypothetical protein